MPRLRVLAGESYESLTPINANKSGGHKIETAAFEGEISVFLKNFVNEHGQQSSTDYFDHPERKGCTWSIQARGTIYPQIGAVCSICTYWRGISRPLLERAQHG